MPNAGIAEKWEPIVGYDGKYHISNHGRVKSFARYSSGKIRSLHVKKNGYIQVDLYIDSVCKYHRVHKLVAGAFIGKMPDGKQVNHIDGIKSNNYVGNLEYVTPSENLRHAFSLGIKKGQKGESNPNDKLSEADVHGIRELLDLGYLTQEEIAEIYGVSRSLISLIKIGDRWGWLQ